MDGESYEVNVNLENQTKVSRDSNTIHLDFDEITELKEPAKTEIRTVLDETSKSLLKGQELVNYLEKSRKNKKQQPSIVHKTSDTSQHKISGIRFECRTEKSRGHTR